VATRAAKLAPTSLVPLQLLLGLIAGLLGAIRDELLLRGFVLRAMRDTPEIARIVACALAAGAAAFGAGHTTPVEIAVAACAGAALAIVWLYDRGAWMAVGTSTAWTFTTGSLVRGGLLDVRSNAGLWGGGDAGIPGSVATLVVVAVVVVAATAWRVRART
jgi:membrane protease YdiL (CAAX protease family)